MSYLERLEGSGYRCEGLPERFSHLSVPIGYVVGSFIHSNQTIGDCVGYCDDTHFGKVCGLAQHKRQTKRKRDMPNKKTRKQGAA